MVDVEGGEIKTDTSININGKASVLDPAACEILVRLFMTRNSKVDNLVYIWNII